jgi:hypothetical protein
MALGLLAAMFAGKTIKNAMDQRDRDQLQAGVIDAFGQQQGAPGMGGGMGGPQFNPDGTIGIQQNQAGLFGAQNPNQIINSASQLFSLPGGSQLGTSLIRDALGFQQQNINQRARFANSDAQQQTRLAHSDAQQQNVFKQADLARSEAHTQQDTQQDNQFEFNKTQAETKAAATASQHKLDRESRELIAANKLQQSATEAAATASGPRLGPVPTGMVEYNTPGRGRYLAALPGSDPYIKAQTQIGETENQIIQLDRILQSITAPDGVTGQQFGASKGQASIRYETAIAGIAKLWNLGVLQEEEAKVVRESLIDPSSIKGAQMSEERITAGYRALQELYQDKLKISNQKYSDWGLGSGLAKSTPAQQRQVQLELEAAGLAQSQGITVHEVAVPRTDRPGGRDSGEAFNGLFPTPGAISQGMAVQGTGSQQMGDGLFAPPQGPAAQF